MTGLYITLCWIAAVTCVIAGIGGGLAFRSGFAHPRAWAGIRVAQATVVAAAALGTVLFAGAGEPGHGLQYGYSLMAAAVSFAAEQLRLASASSVLVRELGVEAVALFVCAALLLRGAGAY
ncbi:MAG: hypothetical protein NT122_03465 [Solirubrobacterales bacterium]|nr:hypothetical protein [Solirubrobacterales bacterium]